MNARFEDFGAFPGQLPGQLPFGWTDPILAKAVDWLRHDGDRRHVPGCQCRKCLRSRTIARQAVRVSDCNCGLCPRCWAAGELRKGRL